jgi:hypothetical protein
MDANIAIGVAILVLALAMGCFLAVALLAAGEGVEPRSGRTPYQVKAGGAFPRPSAGLSARSLPASCYYECMNSFRWAADWGNSCSEACGTGATGQEG